MSSKSPHQPGSLLSEVPVYPNSITDYTASIFQSEFSRADGKLSRDVSSIMTGHCFYHKGMVCDKFDYQLIDQLLDELEAHQTSAPIVWNHHFKYDDPTFSPTFHLITQLLGEYFDLEVLATRLNIYTNSDWKTFHHDSHKYASCGEKEDFTAGLSLGGTRSLAFLHPPTGATFEFPQEHGDVFAFDSEVNSVFMHGVPKIGTSLTQSRVEPTSEHGPRLSIICWGRRKVMTERNCGIDWYDREQERRERERNEKQLWTAENDPDEATFQSNNARYSHYVPPAVKADGGRPSPETSAVVEPEKNAPGIPLHEVRKLMTVWCKTQLAKRAKMSQLKTIFHSANYTPLLNLVLDAFSNRDGAGTLNANRTIANSAQLTKIGLEKHLKLKNEVDNQEALRIQSMPVVYSSDTVLVGPRGLKIRVGATNRRFELVSGHKNKSLSQSSISKNNPQADGSSVEESIKMQNKTSKL
jgi:hypothetical protein